MCIVKIEMKMKSINASYRSPEAEILEFVVEGVLCGSPDGTVETPGEDNFNGWPSL